MPPPGWREAPQTIQGGVRVCSSTSFAYLVLSFLGHLVLQSCLHACLLLPFGSHRSCVYARYAMGWWASVHLPGGVFVRTPIGVFFAPSAYSLRLLLGAGPIEQDGFDHPLKLPYVAWPQHQVYQFFSPVL